MALPEDQLAVQELTAQGTDEALADRVHPRCGVPKPRSRLLTCSFLKRPADPPAARQASTPQVYARYTIGAAQVHIRPESVTAVPHRD